MKKVIFSIFCLVIFFSGRTYINGVDVDGDGKISYITAKDGVENSKKNVYGTIIDDTDTVKKDILDWKNDDGTQKQTSNWYLKYIYKEDINGYDAFCLDPGKHVDSSYDVAKDNDDKFTALFNRKAELAAIYDVELAGKYTLYYAPAGGTEQVIKSITLDEKDEYIIKQLFFWYSANLAKTDPSHNIFITSNRQNWYFADTKQVIDTNGMKWILNDVMYMIYEDVCNAILHHHQLDDDSLINVTDTAYAAVTEYKKSSFVNEKIAPSTANMDFLRH